MCQTIGRMILRSMSIKWAIMWLFLTLSFVLIWSWWVWHTFVYFQLFRNIKWLSTYVDVKIHFLVFYCKINYWKTSQQHQNKLFNFCDHLLFDNLKEAKYQFEVRVLSNYKRRTDLGMLVARPSPIHYMYGWHKKCVQKWTLKIEQQYLVVGRVGVEWPFYLMRGLRVTDCK